MSSHSQKNKPRLGRGLSSLISSSDLPVQAEVGGRLEEIVVNSAGLATLPSLPVSDGQPLMVSVDAIRPNPHQPRKTMNDSTIAELSASMKSSGIIQPLVLRKTPEGFELIAGQRRWIAAKLAGLKEVPAILRDVDAWTQAQMALVENIQREDLNPVERAEGYRTLMQQLGLTQAELAIRMGEDRSSIANFLRLLELIEPVRKMIGDGRLTLGHAKILAGVTDPVEQQRLADLAVAQSLAVRNLEKIIQLRTMPQPPRKPSASPAHIQDLEKSLSRQLGMRVQVRSAAKGRGRLILHYTSLDQFDDLITKLGAQVD